MNINTYFNAKKEMTGCCYKQNCSSECPLGQLNNGLYVNCITLEQDYPNIAEGIIQYYIDNKPTNYFCMKTSEPITDISKCNAQQSCTECQKER